MNGVRCKVLVDSGAEVGVIPRSLVSSDSAECGDVHISDVHGKTSVHQSIIVTYELGGLRRVKLAVIDERSEDDVISIIPFDVTDSEEVKAFRRAVEEFGLASSEKERVEASVNVLTRSQAREEVMLDKNEDGAVVEDLWCVIEGEESVPKELGDELVPSAVPAEEEAMQECLRENVYEGDDVDGVPVELEKVVESEDECESELRELASQIGTVKVGSDGKDFCKAVLEDESLREWRELGERKERGFAWKKGVLVRSLYVTWEEFRDVLVVPKKFRKLIMELTREERELGR